MRFLSLLAVALFVSACAGQGSATQSANAAVKIETSQMYVTVQNNSGMAINDMTVSILPMGRSTTFNKFVGRLENGETRKIMLGDFNGRDGTPFSLRVVKPKSVQVKGTDVAGKPQQAEVDWQ
jgi:hypothetical protein